MAPRDEDVARWVEDRLARLEPVDATGDERRGLVQLRQRSRQPSPRSRRWIGSALAAVTVVVMAIAIPGLRGFAQACGEFVMRTLPGTHSTETYAQAQGRRPFADDEWRDLSGHPIALSAFRGKVVLVSYWTTTCQQCASEVAWFNDFRRHYQERGLEVIGVSVDGSGVAAVKQFVAERPIEYQVVHRDPANANPNLKSIPTTFILDRDGRVAARHVGYCSKRELETDIRTVLSEASADGTKRLQ